MSASELVDTLMVFLKEIFEKGNLQKIQLMTKIMQNFPSCRELNLIGVNENKILHISFGDSN